MRGGGLDAVGDEAGQAGEEGFGEALAGLAVGAGVERGGLSRSGGKAGGEESDQGLATGRAGVEDLGEEGPEGDGGGEESVAEADPFGGDGVVEVVVGEVFAKGVGEGEGPRDRKSVV